MHAPWSCAALGVPVGHDIGLSVRCRCLTSARWRPERASRRLTSARWRPERASRRLTSARWRPECLLARSIRRSGVYMAFWEVLLVGQDEGEMGWVLQEPASTLGCGCALDTPKLHWRRLAMSSRC
jgi:hypothetical protein